MRYVNKLFLGLLLAILFIAGLHSVSFGFEPKDDKFVLVLYSGQKDLAVSQWFEKGLTSSLETGGTYRFIYYFEYMDRFRHTDPTHYRQLLDLYRHKYAGQKIDMIVAFGLPASQWVRAHRDELFPQTPVVVAALLKESFEALGLQNNATAVLLDIDYAGLLDTALRLQPQTRHVAVINGASKTDLYIEKKIRRALVPYADRLDFIYLTRLPYRQIFERVRHLPEHSVVLFYVVARDGDGNSLNDRQVIPDLTKAANAPVFGWLENFIGYGVVGGRLTSLRIMGAQAGEKVLAILAGQNPAEMPISSQGTIINMFDWRQLKRWKIPAKRLPPDSIVRFKPSSYWEDHRGIAVATFLIVCIQSGLIFFLFWQRNQVRRAKSDLAERLRFEELLFELSARFVNLSPDRVESRLVQGLKELAEFLKVDRATLFDLSESDSKLHAVHSAASDGIMPSPPLIDLVQLPWARRKITNGEEIAFSDCSELPAEAAAEKDYFHSFGIQSSIAVPLCADQETLGILTLSNMRYRNEWSVYALRQCRLIADLFANALVRVRNDNTLAQAEEKFRRVADCGYDWSYMVGIDGSLEYVSPSCERISGYTAGEFLNDPSLLRRIVHPQDRALWDGHDEASLDLPVAQALQFRIERRDGQVRWIEHHCQPAKDLQGNVHGFRASNRDITQRKQAEEALENSRQFNQTVLTSLPDQLAVLDRHGSILSANAAWVRFNRENGAEFKDSDIFGLDYLAVCRHFAQFDNETERLAESGIRSVAERARRRFALEYSCGGPSSVRWFRMTVHPFEGKKNGVIVVHSDISDIKHADQKLRKAFSRIEKLNIQLQDERSYLRQEIKLENDFENIVGQSKAIKAVLRQVEQVAKTDSLVMLLGETGTGKELFGRALHSLSRRKHRTMVTLNCAAISPNLFENELFGHEKGAYTGAMTRMRSRFELADGGTLFLDEIGEVPLESQAKLLRVIEHGTFERVGAADMVNVDVRLIAATNQDLVQRVKAGTFREDLYYRLNVFPISLPPLRDRPEDIPLLVWSFIDEFKKKGLGQRISRVPKTTMQDLQRYSWPGNVRELRNLIENGMITSIGNTLAAQVPGGETPSHVSMITLEAAERAHILKVLAQTNWRVAGKDGAAQRLGLKRTTLNSKMKKLNIQRPVT